LRKNNLLEKGWTKTQPFRKRLGQKLQPMAEKVWAKITFFSKKSVAKNIGVFRELI
jgi:hypothetical protein